MSRTHLIKALKSHAQGHIDKHIANVEVHLKNAQGVAEHIDYVVTVEKKLEELSSAKGKLELLKKL